MASLNKLIAVLMDARRYLARPGNDYMWSSWRDNEHAQSELDHHLERLRAGLDPSGLDILFLPTGPMQEVAESSGWGIDFLDLANRYEDAMAENCRCFDFPADLVGEFRDLGTDSNFAEIYVGRCLSCGQHWLRYYFALEAISNSGRWFMGPISEDVSAAEAQATLERLPYYVCGGSYFGGRTHLASGALAL